MYDFSNCDSPKIVKYSDYHFISDYIRVSHTCHYHLNNAVTTVVMMAVVYPCGCYHLGSAVTIE